MVLILTSANIFPQKDDISAILMKKDSVRILVTDSGLGGYSVAAGIDSVLTANRTFKYASVIFCNALPRANFRYNELPDAQSKADIFSSVLNKMQEMFSPDIILIACNTLSVVYPLTEFAKQGNTPVVGIVELGVKAITDSLSINPNASVIIMGTETTIQSEAHKQLLTKNNLAEERVITKSFPNLESEIQVDPTNDMVGNLIEYYLDELPMQSKEETENKIFAALCCTHYGFAKSAFENKLNSKYKHACIINPNDDMIKLFNFPDAPAYNESKVAIHVYSQPIISEDEKSGIGKFINTVSPKARKALEIYTKLNAAF